MTEEDQKFLALLINRTGSATCAATVVALGRAIERWVEAYDKYTPMVEYAVAAEYHAAGDALEALVLP